MSYIKKAQQFLDDPELELSEEACKVAQAIVAHEADDKDAIPITRQSAMSQVMAV